MMPLMITYSSKSLAETEKVAADWLAEISGKADRLKAFVAGLSGHLGAGKTAFVKLVAKTLGIKEEITSPTFVIMKKYQISNSRWKQLIHIDAYRLEKREELNALGFQAVSSDPNNLIMIEWPENVGLHNFSSYGNLFFEIKEGETAHLISIK